jgi:hypothetical protein
MAERPSQGATKARIRVPQTIAWRELSCVRASLVG